MPRKMKDIDQAAPVKAAAAHTIQPTTVYFLADARRDLGLRESTIRRERRAGRLRVGCRAGRCYLLGEWILEWLRGGEAPRKQPHVNQAHPADHTQRADSPPSPP